MEKNVSALSPIDTKIKKLISFNKKMGLVHFIQGAFMMLFALVLKTHLFLFTHYLYTSNRMAIYFTFLPVFSKRYGNFLDRLTK